MTLLIILDSIGFELLKMTNDCIAYLQELRGQSTFNKIALAIPLFVVKLIKGVFISPIVVGGSRWRAYWPAHFRNVFIQMLHTPPHNLRCFNKIGLVIYFIDFYCIATCVHRIFLNRGIITYTYLILKFSMLISQFMYISSADRLPWWVLGYLIMFFEVPIAYFVIHCVGRGIDWNSGQSFYHHWGPHYRYRRMTTNRRITLDLSWYVYPIFKIVFLCSSLCKNKHRTQLRLMYPHKPSWASVKNTTGPDLSALLGIKSGTVNPPSVKVVHVDDYLPKEYWNYPQEEEKEYIPADAQDAREYAEYYDYMPGNALEANEFEQYMPSGGPVHRDLPELPYLYTLIESDTVVNMRYGVLFLLALSSLSVYSIILAGWASNSKYAFIGALRSAAQMISYEVAISLILLPVILLAGSLNLTMITYIQSITVWFLFPLLPASVLFLIAMLAETNRTPFDLPEAEAELVAGYNVDYSSLPFAMFFLGEYCNMILISTLYCLLFLGGGLNSYEINSALILSLKAAIIWIFFVNVRATLPRYRYDQLMDIGWKVFLPIAGGFLVFIFGLLILLDAVLYATELPFDTWKVMPDDSAAAFFEAMDLEYEPVVIRGPYTPNIDYYPDEGGTHELFFSKYDINQ